MSSATITFVGLLLFLAGCAVNSEMRDKTVKVAPSQANVLAKKKLPLTAPKSIKNRLEKKSAHLKIQSLQNKTAHQIIFTLGNPDFRRTDNPAELWQYQHEKCNLDLFLYPQSNKTLSVKFLNVRLLKNTNIAPDLCLQSIIEAKTGTP